ncbi:MAG TPA: cobyrinate a,c-diamide synthase [Symbiobacteriaceae bacterium]|nr:cobyrinate a,c-diamide synthase [Symbiobacteriaceae bacterium]
MRGTPRIVIAGVNSGSGKTTISAGLMRALVNRGLVVQGFKTGPDYIDPNCHRWATERPGRNLDTYLMNQAQVQASFCRGAAGADVAVIEGVMGMFDGAGGGGEVGSTAYLAKLLQAPVVLVIDARACARSAAAIALGFRMFDPAVRLAGVICNRVGSEGHAQMLREALESVGIPMLGALHHDAHLRVTEDRLGLALPGGTGSLPGWMERAGELVERHVDLDQVLALANAAGPVVMAEPDPSFAAAAAGRYAGLRIAVGLDAAFWFYYEDTFDLLRHWGVEIRFFSPESDEQLPPGVHGLYLGGGFPERRAGALSANLPMRTAVMAAWLRRLPVLAECGGYLYLLEGLTGEDGVVYPMAGCIPGVARLQPRLQGMGYRTAEPLGIRGHLFHYSRVEGGGGPPAWRLFRSNGEFERADGYRSDHAVASYLHVHHATQPAAMEAFLEQCRRYKEERGNG